MAGASGNSGTPAIQRARDFAGLEAVADAGGYGQSARFVITLTPRELPY